MTGIDADREFVGVVDHLRHATLLQSRSSPRPGPIGTLRRLAAAEDWIFNRAQAKVMIKQVRRSQLVIPENKIFSE